MGGFPFTPTQEQQDNADTDGGIRQIERGIAFPRKIEWNEIEMELQEVGHMAEPESVDDVSRGAAGNHAVGDSL